MAIIGDLKNIANGWVSPNHVLRAFPTRIVEWSTGATSYGKRARLFGCKFTMVSLRGEGTYSAHPVPDQNTQDGDSRRRPLSKPETRCSYFFGRKWLLRGQKRKLPTSLPSCGAASITDLYAPSRVPQPPHTGGSLR
jgi:hypothetical protein